LQIKLAALALFGLALNPAQANDRARAIVAQTAAKHGVPVELALAVAKVESGFRCNARSRANARGVMQVLPATARGVGVHGNLFDCRTGAEAGMRYLAAIIRRHGVNCASVSLYERGAHARPRCTAYGRKVMSRVR
jgi:soluble lytic murein transglycosylase-like protein